MKIWIPISLLFLIGLWSACEREPWNLEPKDFIQIEMDEPVSPSINSITLSSVIKDWRVASKVDDYGFLWNRGEKEPTLFVKDGSKPLGEKFNKSDTTFMSTIEGLDLDTRYTFRAYVKLDDSVYYSKPREYETNKPTVITMDSVYVEGFEIELRGQLTGTETGIDAVQHGFCWSGNNPIPTIRKDELKNLGRRNDNELFTYQLDLVTPVNILFYRAYAIMQDNFENDTIYGIIKEFDRFPKLMTQLADFGGPGLNSAVGFSIGDIGYIGTGSSRQNLNGGLSDFWAFDPTSNEWTEKADIAKRTEAVGFSIGDKGYIGTGWDGSKELNDFWEYDPATNMWNRRADFPGSPRIDAVGFSIGDKGYIGTGWDGSKVLNDFWEFDPQSNTWTKKTDFPGTARRDAVGFSIGNKGYIGTGTDKNRGSLYDDFWEFDPQMGPMGTWTQKDNIDGLGRREAVGFSIGNKGYIASGTRNNVKLRDIWEYDSSNPNPIWTELNIFPSRNGRDEAVGFVIGKTGYIGTGITELIWNKDFYAYDF